MTVPTSRKSRKHGRKKVARDMSAMGGTHIKFGGRVFKGGGAGRGSKSTEATAAPVWVAGGIPDQGPDAQPTSLNVAVYTEKTPYTITYSLVTPPAGFYITPNGKITVTGAAAAAHSITVRATNAGGQAEDTFTWTIT